jgi:hypothetical protein
MTLRKDTAIGGSIPNFHTFCPKDNHEHFFGLTLHWERPKTLEPDIANSIARDPKDPTPATQDFIGPQLESQLQNDEVEPIATAKFSVRNPRSKRISQRDCGEGEEKTNPFCFKRDKVYARDNPPGIGEKEEGVKK